MKLNHVAAKKGGGCWRRVLASTFAGVFGLGLTLLPQNANAIGFFDPQGSETNTYIDGNFYVSHTWLTSGTFTVPDSGVSAIEYFVVAGGGGGGRGGPGILNPVGGGGGAGGVLTGTLPVTPGEVYTITVGAGGLGATANTVNGTNGSNSSLVRTTPPAGPSLVADGGGGGGRGESTTNAPGNVGGSGGGRGVGANGATGAAGTLGQGFAGGGGGGASATFSFRGAGGGGGGGGVGASGTAAGPNGGNGGLGVSNNFRTGTTAFYAGGGGGASNSLLGGSPGVGGSGVGGLGAGIPDAPGIDAVASTGSGGGGGRAPRGGNGSAGIVIIRYFDDGTLSVDLTALSATAAGIGSPVTIAWETAAEHDNAGFNVYRAENGAPGQKLNAFPIAAQGTETEGASYSFVDSDPIGADEVRGYYLEDVEFNGTKALHGPVRVGPFTGARSAVDSWALYN